MGIPACRMGTARCRKRGTAYGGSSSGSLRPAAGPTERRRESGGLSQHRISPPGAPAIREGKPRGLRGSSPGTGAEPSPGRTELGGGDGTEVVFEGPYRPTAATITSHASLPDPGIFLE